MFLPGRARVVDMPGVRRGGLRAAADRRLPDSGRRRRGALTGQRATEAEMRDSPDLLGRGLSLFGWRAFPLLGSFLRVVIGAVGAVEDVRGHAADVLDH